MEASFGSVAAGGGVTGAIVVGLYLLYKCCYRKKLHSKCCGASLDIEAGEASPVEEKAPTPKPSPMLKPVPSPESPPIISV